MKHLLSKTDFKATITSTGYMLKYKGQSIGGAGIKGSVKPIGQARLADLNNYCESAHRDIESLCNGYGPDHMRKAIDKINQQRCDETDHPERHGHVHPIFSQIFKTWGF